MPAVAGVLAGVVDDHAVPVDREHISRGAKPGGRHLVAFLSRGR
jgi:hypothetical protein